MKYIFEKIHKNSERGQAIILVAFAVVGLVAILGLMIDGGILLIEYARLKRGIDAASIASASQFRKGFDEEKLRMAGQEFLRFNQSDAVVFISICNPSSPALPDPLPKIQPTPPQLYHDPGLCFNPPRKLVRVTANRHVNFGFMRIVGINGTDIESTSVGEAASIDLVLVIDNSSSMAFDTNDYNTIVDGKKIEDDPANPADPANFPGDNPEVCNDFLPSSPGRCQPLGDIIDVAVNFVQDQLLFYPFDQVALISTAGRIMTSPNPAIQSRDPVLVLPFNNNYNEATDTATTEIQTAIRALKVFEPVRCDTPEAAANSLGGCLRFFPVFPDPTGTYNSVGYDRIPVPPNDRSAAGSSNIGGALRMAGQQFDTARQESFWVTIALLGGPATATDSASGIPTGFCPSTTWPPLGRGCRDFDTPSVNAGFNPATFDWTDATRHNFTWDTSTDPDTVTYPADYDADDYARDAADYITSPTDGQGATIYSICLGTLCRYTTIPDPSDPTDSSKNTINPAVADPYSGEHLAEYIAEYSGGPDANHGLYYFSNNSSGLSGIFSDISDNIFTRISQ